METRLYPSIMLGQLIERLDDISLRMQGVDHKTCRILSEIAEVMENQFRIWDIGDPDHRTEITLTDAQWAFLDRIRDGAR
jgi:hypothetical protein